MTGRPAFEVLFHPDYMRLETELVRRVSGFYPVPAGAPPPRILVLAPSKRQVLRLRRILAGKIPAALGLEVHTHLSLTRALLERRSPGAVPDLAAPPLREAVIEHVLALKPDLDLSAYAAEHVSVPTALAGVFGELREAGIAPDDLDPLRTERRITELAELFRAYETALESLAEQDASKGQTRPWTDRAGLTRAAAAAAADLEPYDAVFQYGAYDLVGMNLNLVLALPAAAPPVFLVPADPTAPAWEPPRKFFARHLDARPAVLDDPEDGPRAFVAAARSYRDWENEPARLPEGAITLTHAQGSESELNGVARRVLRLLADGTPPARIGIVARNLEGYSAVAEQVFERHRIPVDSSMGFPLSRYPKARTFLYLLQAMHNEYPRQKLIDLVRAPNLRRPEGSPAETWWPDVWDRWSRRFGIVRGAGQWRRTLSDLVENERLPPSLREDDEAKTEFEEQRERRVASARALGDAVGAWEREHAAWRRCGHAHEHREFLDQLARRWIRRWDARDSPDEGEVRINDALASVLLNLEALEVGAQAAYAAVEGRPREDAGLTPDEVLAYLERAVHETEVPWSVENGVHLLDVMQARGLVFDHTFLIGFNADVFPRRPRDDVFLPDAVRAALRERTGRPLAIRGETSREEYLLLAQTLAGTREHLVLSWQRADAAGSARSVSLQLREVARLLPRTLPLNELLESEPPEGPERVPTHPAHAARWMHDRFGMVTPEEGALFAADAAVPRSTDAARAFLTAVDPERAGRLSDSFALIEAVEDTSGNGAYDGTLGEPVPWDRPYSATGLERMGTCPLKFLFRDVLRVRPLDEAAEELKFDDRELGIAVHNLLERIYRDLLGRTQRAQDRGTDQTDLFASGSAAHADTPDVSSDLAFAEASLERHWPDVMGAIESRVRPRFPVLWHAAAATWKEELRRFLARDLRRLADEGLTLGAMEVEWDAVLSLPDPSGGDLLELPLWGKLDRVATGSGGRVLVSDYKTGGNLENWIKHEEFLQAKHLQLPLYTFLAESKTGSSSVEAELLGLGFKFLPDRGFVRRGEVRLTSKVFDEAQRGGLEETLAVLLRLNRAGTYPFNPDRHCSWCDFKTACRRYHAASRKRVEDHPDHEDYFLVKGKSMRSPLIEAVREKRKKGRHD